MADESNHQDNGDKNLKILKRKPDGQHTSDSSTRVDHSKEETSVNVSDADQTLSDLSRRERNTSSEDSASADAATSPSRVEAENAFSTDDSAALPVRSNPPLNHDESGRRDDTTDASHDQNDLKRNSDFDEYEDNRRSSEISYGRKEPDLLESILEKASDQTLLNGLLGCAYGQALGDAYGLSTEFETRQDVARTYKNHPGLIPFPDYVLTSHSSRWTRGDWTDDTDQWILILETLIENDGKVEVFAKKLTKWIRNGYRELGDHGGMGLGANVSQVVHSHGYLEDPLKASEMVWRRGNCQAAPNGAVMRCSASAFVHFNDVDKVISTTMQMCKTTHFDPRCIASCLAVCLTITYMLRREFDNNNIELLVARVQNETIELLGASFSEEHRQLFLWHTDRARTLEELNLDESRAIGYTYKCLASGFYGLRSIRSFEETLNDLIRYGGDADTNGAVCGTMYGARHGYHALPKKWLKAMPFKKWFDKKIIQCFTPMNLI